MLSAESTIHREYNFAIRLMKHMVVPTFVLDAEGRVIIWNKACERLTGLAADEVLGTRDHWKAFYDAPRPCLADLIVRGDTAAIGTLYACHTDTSDASLGSRAENWCLMPRLGSQLYLAIDAGPIYDEDGSLSAVVETLRDITAQKNAELALQELASIDGLTRIANRRHFDETLRQEWKRAQRTGEAVGLLLCDIDFFKPYNDTYGHQRGDDCLRAVAAAIKTSLFRPADLVARYGGEEFVVVLPNADIAASVIIAERILECIRALELPHRASTVAEYITASIGVASTVPEVHNDIDQLITAADLALYRAKHDGRNRLKIADQEIAG